MKSDGVDSIVLQAGREPHGFATSVVWEVMRQRLTLTTSSAAGH
jgi:hypothetical protein